MNGGDIAIDRARARLLGPAGLDEAAIGRALGHLAGGGADLADLFFETTSLRSWRLEGGRVTNGGFAMRQGVGARAAHGGHVSFAHSADMREGALQDTVRAVRSLARDGDTARQPQGIALTPAGGRHDLYPVIDAVAVEDATAWIAMLERIDQLAREHDPRIVRIDANVRAQDTTVLIANADGQMAGDVRPMTILSVMVVAEAEGHRARGQAGLGRRAGQRGFDAVSVETMVATAVRMAINNLDAIPAPVGEMPVVLGPEVAEVWLDHRSPEVGGPDDGRLQAILAAATDADLVMERVSARVNRVGDDGPDLLEVLGDDEEAPSQGGLFGEDFHD